MKTFYIFSACLFGFLTTIHEAETSNTGCLEREKALAFLQTAENSITNAKESIPTCNSREEEKPRDCAEILGSGSFENGIYTIWTEDSFTTGKSLKVYCDMETVGGGWTVIQRRGEYKVQRDFYMDWENYKNGFGKLTSDFWLGNENIRVLCRDGCKIRFDLLDLSSKEGFAIYENFSLSSDNYRLNISGYTGTAGDSMQGHNGNIFSTKDKGNTRRATEFKGGWWYSESKHFSNLNGFYQSGRFFLENVIWNTFREKTNLRTVEMKVRRK